MKYSTIELFLGQKGLCFYCSRPMKFIRGQGITNFTIDHFFPKSKGNKLDGNSVLCHFKCNMRKGDKEPNNKEQVRFRKLYQKIKRRLNVLQNMKKGK